MDDLPHFRVDEVVEGVNVLPHEAAHLKQREMRRRIRRKGERRRRKERGGEGRKEEEEAVTQTPPAGLLEP